MKIEEELQLLLDGVDEKKSLGGAIKTYEQIIAHQDNSEEVIKVKEKAIYNLASIFSEKKLADELITLLENILPILKEIPQKSKTAKIVRTIFDFTTKIPGNETKLIELCEKITEWCDENKRTFLKHRIQTKLSELLFKQQRFADSLKLLDVLLHEIKKLDDKNMLVELQLIESQVYHALHNIPKSKASLTSVKTASTSIYIVPNLQAQIDMQSGVISAEEKDFNTAYSYFYESFEGFNSLGEYNLAEKALKYMLMSKIMKKLTNDALNIINSQLSLKYQGRNLECMREIAKAVKEQNLLAFERAKETYAEEIESDANVLQVHISNLYDTLLEDNLKKIIEPYSEVQIDFIAKQIGLPMQSIQQKLSEMILDEKIEGTLDQGRGCLTMFEEVEDNKAFDHTIEIFEKLSHVIDAFYDKTKQVKKLSQSL
uniref:PCI domain-containing protein n=1 Tax=Euplotes harpa TaxID=151035 RepID=A0A7S3J6W6_9SPIT